MSEENDEILNKVKSWLFPTLCAALGGVLSMQVNQATSKIDSLVDKMQEQITTAKVQSTQFDYLTQRISNLEQAKKEAGTTHDLINGRLNSLEQRAAISDGYMENHTSK